MALIIDDGTLETGNTFATLDEADIYHGDRLTTDWIEKTIPDKEAAMIRAFDYLKVLPWNDTAFALGVPDRVKEAQIKAAVKEVKEPGTLQQDQTSNIKRKKIEGAIETEYFQAGKFSGTIHTDINALLQPYLIAPAVVRAARHLVRR